MSDDPLTPDERAFLDASLAERRERQSKEVARQARERALDLIEEHLLQDRDQFVRERTWNALRRLMGQGVERAEDLCARLIELA